MAYAIDLGPRQTTRTLEQAVRHQTDVLLLPRVRPDDEPIMCRLESIEAPSEDPSGRGHLAVTFGGDGRPAGGGSEPECSEAVPAGTGSDRWAELVGTYCDVTIQLGENRYLFCSDVVSVAGVPDASGAVRLCLARPETIQVAQRRRFWRFQPARSSQVELRRVNGDPSAGGSIGWLCNVSGDGLACRVDAEVADRLGIGEQVEAEFTLTSGDEDRFVLDAALCSKTPAGTEGSMILGLQFLTGPGHASSADAAEALRQRLLAEPARPVEVLEGVDA